MSASQSDRNLLFGILALQMEFITQAGLIAALHAWMLQKSKPLGELLVELGHMSPDDRAAMEPMVDRHVARHGGSAEQCLAALSPVPEVAAELRELNDADVQDSLGHVAARASRQAGILSGVIPPNEPRNDDDPAAAKDADDDDLPPQLQPTLVQTMPEEAGRPAMRFLVLRPHAEGGLGTVSIAKDRELNREVAFKEIKPKHAHDKNSRGRFVLEAEITGGLEHPGIVPVYGLGHFEDGRPFYAMRFIRGRSLKEAIEKFHAANAERLTSSLDFEQDRAFRNLIQRLIDVCNAIAYAHSRGVLHRDLKPGNIMLGKYGETLVVDWGLAKAKGQSFDLAASASASTIDHESKLIPSGSNDVVLTQMGNAIGTPKFMSPEQAAGRLDLLGPASDVYSLGATLYELLTGQAAIGARSGDVQERLTISEVLRRVEQGEFPAPRTILPAVPAALEAVCLRAMSREPRARYATAQAMAEDLERWLAGDAVSAWREPILVRAKRWGRKHQTLVGSTAAAVLVAVVTLSVLVALVTGKNQQLASANNTIREKRDEAIKQKTRADAKAEEARRHLYSAHMNLAQRNWEDMQIGLVLESLRTTIPHSGETDLRGFEWYYWDRLCHSSLLDLKGHTGPVSSVAFSSDGKRLASASADNTVKVWDAMSGQETLTLKDAFGRVAFSPDGKRLAAASADNTVKVWDATSGQEMLTLKDAFGGVAFSPDGKRLASASGDGMVMVWDATSGERVLTLEGHTHAVHYVTFSPDSKRLASASDDQTVKLWDVTSGEQTRTLIGHSGPVVCVAFSPDGKRLASACTFFFDFRDEPGEVKVWDATNGQELITLNGYTKPVQCVAFSADGKRLALASKDQTVKVWDTTRGQETLTFKGHTGPVSSVAFSSDGKRLASASWDQTVKLWDEKCGLNSLTLKWNPGLDSSVAFSADGKQLEAASGDRMKNVWDTTSGQATFREERANIGAIKRDKELPVVRRNLSLDGKWMASVSDDKAVRIRDAASGQEILSLNGHTDQVMGVAFSPDGKRLVSASWDQTVKVWDTASGQETLTLKGHTSGVMGVAFSVDGKWVASASADKTVKLWDAASGREILTLKGHTDRVNCVAFSADGRRLASASDDETVKVWDAMCGQEMLTLKGHTLAVDRVTFSSDGKRLASISGDGTVKVWDARPWTPELRAEREALSLIHFLRDQGQPQSEWLNAISSDQTLSEPVRQRALQFAREWKPEEPSNEPTK